MKDFDSVVVELTEGNMRNDHFYLREALHLFPNDAIGGPNRASGLGVPVTVKYVPGPTVATDIEGRGRFFRVRLPTREFFRESGARAGDKVRVARIGARDYTVTLAR